MRKIATKRQTNETEIALELNLDGRGIYRIDSGCGFFDHMLELFARHGHFDLELRCQGDTKVDFHHTVEDIAITLGQAFCDALAEKKGITRYGSFVLPMDETLILTAVDLSGRSYLNFEVSINKTKVGDFDTELVKEFMLAFSRTIKASIHIKQLAGENSHHIIEAIFKCFARSLAIAIAIDEKYADEIPSTKGTLA
ncbi:MAG: imidazoleglycerol-phosphate dehydratase HisB [Bacillota bacterium]|jgi:imidazoleglycerol-phosphate dehydratase